MGGSVQGRWLVKVRRSIRGQPTVVAQRHAEGHAEGGGEAARVGAAQADVALLEVQRVDRHLLCDADALTRNTGQICFQMALRCSWLRAGHQYAIE